MWSSGLRHILMENTSFDGFRAGPHRQDHPALVKGILETVDFLPYSPDLNPLDFSIWRILQAEVQAKPHGNLDALCLFIDAERDWLAVEYIQRTCCSCHYCEQAIMAKNAPFIE
jgi:hypothetical protein